MWIRYIPTKVFNALQRKGREKLKNTYDYTGRNKFPTVNFTTVNKNKANLTKEEQEKEDAKRKFPTVYLKKLQGQPRGRTLEDTKVNAILSSFQIEVVTNTNQTDAEIIADVLADIMIDMGFDMVGEPFPDNDYDTYRNVSRWQRLIGYNDKLNF